MLNVLGGWDQNCSGVSRRRVLQAGSAGLFGLSLAQTLAAEASGVSKPAKAKNVIFLLLFGGPSQLETFDMKPDAAGDIRGPFQPIASRTPGLRICEHLPQLAKISDKFCVVRNMSHSFNDHSGGAHYIQTGKRWHIPIGAGFNRTDKDWPSVGSVVDYFAQQSEKPRDVPTYMMLPAPLGHLQSYSSKLERPGQYGGWLGRAYDPLATDIRKRDPKDNPFFRTCTDDELDFRIHGLAAEGELTLDRLDGRRSLLEQFDQARSAADDAAFAGFDEFRRRALSLVTNGRTRDALDLRRESAATRDRYGRHLFGQSTLVARRLVEAGVRYVTVGWDAPDGYSWDSHTHSDDVKSYLLPGLDQALSALLTDLDQSGLLDETLVVCTGEMGRTPKPNARWGRQHWSTLFSTVLAGGGIRGGQLYGESDADAAYALDGPSKPEDLAATILTAMGIDPETRLKDPQDRPVPIVENGRVLPIFG
ncbi:MAG: DUF1501 domain-containing protein [Planctomycetales bacterium]|nr:DUF1501 domain-containing protein [Planctomycetales bacterium]MBN8626042.1 DUF1501 domain-containing protein [Planctomycetota bacterium]